MKETLRHRLILAVSGSAHEFLIGIHCQSLAFPSRNQQIHQLKGLRDKAHSYKFLPLQQASKHILCKNDCTETVETKQMSFISSGLIGKGWKRDVIGECYREPFNTSIIGDVEKKSQLQVVRTKSDHIQPINLSYKQIRHCKHPF